MKPEIMLSSGEYYSFVDPNPDVVTIEVIAGALSKMCRYSGHSSRHYSVSEHCVRASYIVPEEDALEALMHDAAEALVVDLPTPLKHLLPDYMAYEHAAEALIAKRFNLRYPWPPSVKVADIVMLATERRDLLPPDKPGENNWALIEGVVPLQDDLAAEYSNMAFWEARYIARFKELAR